MRNLNNPTHKSPQVKRYSARTHTTKKKMLARVYKRLQKIFLSQVQTFSSCKQGAPFFPRSVAKAVFRRKVRCRLRSAFIPLVIATENAFIPFRSGVVHVSFLAVTPLSLHCISSIFPTHKKGTAHRSVNIVV